MMYERAFVHIMIPLALVGDMMMCTFTQEVPTRIVTDDPLLTQATAAILSCIVTYSFT